MIVLFAFLTALVGAFSFYFYEGSKYVLHWVIRFVVYFFIMWLVNYLALFSFRADTIFLASIILLFISCIYDLARSVTNSDTDEIGHKINVGATIVIFVVLMGCWFGSCNLFYAKGLYNIAAQNKIDISALKWDPVSDVNIRYVPEDHAIWRSRRSISKGGQNWGSLYAFSPDSMTIQRVNGRLYWVGPMEFGGVGKQRSAKTTPGFIMVNACNDSDVNLVTQKPDGAQYRMKYLVKSWWGKRLMRYLRREYPSRIFTDLTFELDETLRPWQVVSWIEPTKWFRDGWITRGVIVVDPETGKHTEYTMNNIPDWIDRVVPEKVAIAHLKWLGKYHHGWRIKKSWKPYSEDMKPTETPTAGGEGHETEVWFVYGSDGEPYWFTGMTSLASTDQSLVAKAFVNSRTGKIITIPCPKGGSDESAVLQAVKAKIAKQNVNIDAVEPTPVNVYGQANAWVVPVITAGDGESPRGQLLYVAVVDGEKGTVVLGDNKNEALLRFKSYIGQSGQEVVLSKTAMANRLEGKIVKWCLVVIDGMSHIRFKIDNADSIFDCPLDLADAMTTGLEIAEVGDPIRVDFEQTTERIVPVTEYKILNQKEIISESQSDLLELKRQQGETEKTWNQPTKE